MKKYVLLYLSFFWVHTAIADHITGGEIYYSLTGISGGQYQYSITLKLFMVCNTERQFNNPTYVSFFNKGTGERVKDVSVNLARTELLSYTPGGPCISNPPTVCYRVGYYNFSITLPASEDGYILSSQVIYRVDGMKNLLAGYDQVGATYTAEIPGNALVPDAPANNSAQFTGDDLVVICANNSFSYSFAAKDKDNDQLSYSFCNAYRETSGGFSEGGTPTGPPPYTSLPYGQGYNGSLPLGANVSINPATGLLSGVAPAEGTYVISVCVAEIRNNTVIATQRKDIQITITSCSIAAATLLPEYNLCGDTKNISIRNMSNSPLIKTFDWQFTNAAGAIVYTTTQQQANYTFPDTGIYKVKLIINKSDACSDSAVSMVRVYPGFVPGFRFNGICLNKPTQFTDTSVSVYGNVNSWNWDFGDNNSLADASGLQHPAYTYTTAGTKNVRLITSDSKGCTDTVFGNVTIVDKPPLATAFKDTLICKRDSVQLFTTGSGNYTWSPNIFITATNIASPIVSPPVTTTYYVDLNDNGCLNRDSLTIHVVDQVALQAMGDTTICSGDTITLGIISNGLKYSWTPASSLINAGIKNPLAVTSATTTYEVLAQIGSCSAKENITISTIDYPVAIAGNDTMICFQTGAELHGITDGSSFTWSPSATLQYASTLHPVAYPASTTAYVLSAWNTKGCPKPGRDTVTVTVLPPIHAFAGNDTAIVAGQTLQLNASGGIKYNWLPATGLSDAGIANPLALYSSPSEGIRYKVYVYNEAGCVDSASLTVKVFGTLPTVFVPTGFTPNGDGRNDVLKPIAVGMQRMELFNIYNRWGQLLFSTAANGKGWDGTVSGQKQSAGTYIWMLKAVDYTGAQYMQRGTVVLIR
ncbi:T9SS type B sorting domain-containing protein [Ilyomonas limi]|uniref:T9SS type B sorting domain-containing protein n=1 Tax=Ilyomonas limi TaxID=2575867 RepID=A0A4U3KUD8_9BACT|nr:PKD domain-containing protein [Ilyomonas limi]TKK65962.1 T9SS type B sorting domain-containing protein [Ilyomonas limi]